MYILREGGESRGISAGSEPLNFRHIQTVRRHTEESSFHGIQMEPMTSYHLLSCGPLLRFVSPLACLGWTPRLISICACLPRSSADDAAALNNEEIKGTFSVRSFFLLQLSRTISSSSSSSISASPRSMKDTTVRAARLPCAILEGRGTHIIITCGKAPSSFSIGISFFHSFFLSSYNYKQRH